MIIVKIKILKNAFSTCIIMLALFHMGKSGRCENIYNASNICVRMFVMVRKLKFAHRVELYLLLFIAESEMKPISQEQREIGCLVMDCLTLLLSSNHSNASESSVKFTRDGSQMLHCYNFLLKEFIISNNTILWPFACYHYRQADVKHYLLSWKGCKTCFTKYFYDLWNHSEKLIICHLKSQGKNLNPILINKPINRLAIAFLRIYWSIFNLFTCTMYLYYVYNVF